MHCTIQIYKFCDYCFFFFFQAAEFLDIPDLFNVLNGSNVVEENSSLLNKTISTLEDLCLVDGVFSDILFKLEDGTCAAHKGIY